MATYSRGLDILCFLYSKITHKPLRSDASKAGPRQLEFTPCIRKKTIKHFFLILSAAAMFDLSLESKSSSQHEIVLNDKVVRSFSCFDKSLAIKFLKFRLILLFFLFFIFDIRNNSNKAALLIMHYIAQ